MDNDERLQGRCESTLKSLNDNLVQEREEFRLFRYETLTSLSEMNKKLDSDTRVVATILSKQESLNEKLDSHIASDDGRFGLIWKVMIAAGFIGGSGTVAVRMLISG